MEDKDKHKTTFYRLTYLPVNPRVLHTVSAWLLICVYSQLSTAWACGVNAHLWITDSAICQLPMGSTLREFYSIQRHVDLTRLGSAFPDSGYAINHAYGEIAHWPPFIQAYIEDFHERHGAEEETWTNEALAEIAFILGIAAHGYEDELFDSQFLRWIEQEDQANQDVIDPALDFLLLYEGHSELLPPLDFPALGVSSALQRAGVEVSVSELETGVARVHQFALRLSQNPSALRALVERDAPLIPWTSQHYLNSRITGSLAHEPQRVAALLEGLYKRLSGQSIANEVISHLDPSPPAQLSFASIASGSQAQWITLYFKTGVNTESVIQNIQLLVNDEVIPVNYRGTRWGGGEGYTRLFELTPINPISNLDTQVMELIIQPGLELIDGDFSSVRYSYQIQLCETCEALPEIDLNNYGGQQQGCLVIESTDMMSQSDESINEQDVNPNDLTISQQMPSDIDSSFQDSDHNMPNDTGSMVSHDETRPSQINQGCVQVKPYRNQPQALFIFLYFVLSLLYPISGINHNKNT